MLTEEQRDGLLAQRVEMVAVVLPGGDMSIVVSGKVDRVRVTPSVVLRPVLLAGYDSYGLVHTHPHGGGPSGADYAVTRRLVAASAVLGLRLTGHLVLAPEGTWDCLDPQQRLQARRALTE